MNGKYVTAGNAGLRLVHNVTHTLALRCGTVRRHAVRYPAIAYFPFTNFRCSAGTVMATGKWRRIHISTYTRQMLSIVASGSDASHATVVNGFFYSALVVVRELS